MFDKRDIRKLAADLRRKLFDLSSEGDVIVTVDPLHVAYLTGYRTCLIDMVPGYRTAAVAERNSIRLVTGRSDAAPALDLLREPASIYSYGTFAFSDANGQPAEDVIPPSYSDFDVALKAAIDDAMAPGDALVVDAPDDGAFEWLCRRLDLQRVSKGRNLFLNSRRTKLGGELARIQEAARITELGLTKALDVAKAGMSEHEFASIIAKEMVAGGGVPRFIVVASGERGSLVDAHATPRKFEPGDLVRIDIACSFQGYWSDMARTAVVGDPTKEQQARYDSLLAGMEAEIETVKPGARVSDLFDTAVQAIRSRALPAYTRHHCGHGIGCLGHEAPTIGPQNTTSLESGMALCMETPYYQPGGWGGMMVEDMIVVTDDGMSLLTHSDRSLRII